VDKSCPSVVYGIYPVKPDILASMSVQNPIRPGDIFWHDRFPPLDGGVASRHPVIVVDDDATLAEGRRTVVVVGVTSTDCDDFDRVDLPNRHDEVGAETGLDRPCCALPRWFVTVARATLRERLGRLPEVTLAKLMEAVDKRAEAGDHDVLADF
jgi:mRNA-degrading endonuclease toxin of MazEF toxin-antitoxin module